MQSGNRAGKRRLAQGGDRSRKVELPGISTRLDWIRTLESIINDMVKGWPDWTHPWDVVYLAEVDAPVLRARKKDKSTTTGACPRPPLRAELRVTPVPSAAGNQLKTRGLKR